MNNNQLTEQALLAGCKGVFSKASYITIGSKEKPEDYVKKIPPRSVFAGKQFGVAPPKEGADVFSTFDRKHPWISDGDKFVDKLKYKETQGDNKKKGFLTSDFSKRDEFSNTVRTAQYREQLKTESAFAKKGMELLSSTKGAADHIALTSPKKEEPETFLYDLVFEKEDPNFSGASRTHRDTKNRTWLSKDRAMGEMMTTHQLTFSAPEDFSKPDHARRPLIRDTFYRKTNIMFPSGCSADPDS